MNAFRLLGESHIPALVVNVTDEDAFIMSLAENIARRGHRPLEILADIELLLARDHSIDDIITRTGLSEKYVRDGPLADLVADRKAAFPSSGEINFTLDDPQTAIARVRSEFEPSAISINEMDGLGFHMDEWRFNLRSSNTEPVVRLNVEARGDAELVAKGVERVKRTLIR